MKKIIINARESEKRLAVIKNNKVERLLIEQPYNQSKVGNIYLGVVEKVVPSLNAAFVHLGQGMKGYIHRNQMESFALSTVPNKHSLSVSSFVHQGEKLIVQIKKDETDQKIYRLTGLIELTSQHVVYIPNGHYVAISKKLSDEERDKWRKWAEDRKEKQEGLLIRTCASSTSIDNIFMEWSALRDQYKQLLSKAKNIKAPSLLEERDNFLEEIVQVASKEKTEIICDDLSLIHQLQQRLPFTNIEYYNGKKNIFSTYNLASEMEKASKKVIWLPNGAYVILEHTEACTVIDVNTGKFVSKGQKEAAIFETNMLAAKEIARQIILQNISGMILIDFINMNESVHKEKLIRYLQEQFSLDPVTTEIKGFTSLGILEMTRKREKSSMKETLMTNCPVCGGTGFVHSAMTKAFQLERELWEYKGTDISKVIVEASKDIISLFEGENKKFKENLEQTLKFVIEFQEVSTHCPDYVIRKMLDD